MNYFIRMIVYVCLYTWLVVGLGYGQCGKQVFNPETGLLDCTGVMGSGSGVGGATALTTAGAIPFVTSAGTLGQDGALTFDSTGKKLTVAQGALTASNPALSATATWNAAGVTFTHLLANVTDTASAAASLLLDLQVGGTSKFSVTKAGAVTAGSVVSVAQSSADGVFVKNGGVSKQPAIGWLDSGGALKGLIGLAANSNDFVSGASANDLVWKTINQSLFITINNGTSAIVSLKSGSVGIGPSNTAPTGTLSVVDRTATTGATTAYFGTDGTNTSATTTQVVVRAGQAQSTTKLTEWRANGGGVLAAVGPGGGFITAATAAETLANDQCTLHKASNTQLTFTCKGSDGTLRTNTLTLI